MLILKIRIFLFVFIVNLQLISQDNIVVKTTPDSLFANSSNHSLKVTIQNNTEDTFLTIKEFWPVGFSSNQLTYPMGSYYHPNLIGFSNLNEKIFITDGIYWKYYDSIPDFLAINPKDSIIISIEFNEIYKYLVKSDWFVFHMFNFAKKFDLDYIFKESYPNQIEEFINKIQFCKFSNYEIRIDSSYIENKHMGKYDKIKEAFK